MTGGQVRYGGWSRDRHGWLFGLTGAAWTVIAAGGAPLLLATAAHRWMLAVVWLPVWAVLIVAVALPVRGRPAARWVTDSAHRAVGLALGWSAWTSKAAAAELGDPREADLPGVLAGVRAHDGPPHGPLLSRPVLVADHRDRTWAVTARISQSGIGLAEAASRDRFGSGLSELLDAAATGGLLSRLALQVRTIPDDGAERTAWHDAHARADAPGLAREVNAAVAAVMTGAAVRHEAFVTLVVPEARIARAAREAGGGIDGRARVLHGLMTEVEARLLGPVGCTAVTWLDSPALAAAVRSGFAPGDRPLLTDTTWPMAAAGPTGCPPPERRCYTHDAWRSVTCAILLPDKGAVMGALAPVLAPSVAGERRCVTVFFEPLGPHRAQRLVGAESMSADLAAEVRRRSGLPIRAAQRRDAARVAGQDVRLADGSALVRVAVAAAVTVPDSWPIADHGRRLEAAITTAGFTPLRLDLAQDSGFAAACIPLGIGLPKRRGLR